MKRRRIICALLALLLPALLRTAAWGEGEPACLNLDGQGLNYPAVKEILAGYSGLERVDMFDIPVDYRQAEELETLYPGVEFGWTLKIGNDHLVRTDATAFSTLHLSGSETHTMKEISVLRYCKHLRALDFGHNGVDDISWLAELTDLRVLIIAVNRVSDITPLAGLTRLEYLEIFNNRITDISPLAGLTHLMDLNICWNRITDYSPLYGMTGLKRLWIGNAGMEGGGVPAEVVARLQKNLPDCRIDWKSKPTLGGWREHEHYEVIHTMFAGSEYIPFSDSFPDFPADDEEDDL